MAKPLEALVNRRAVLAAAGVSGLNFFHRSDVAASSVTERNHTPSLLDSLRLLDIGEAAFPIPRNIDIVRFSSNGDIYALAHGRLFRAGFNQASGRYGDYSPIALDGIEQAAGLVVKDNTVLITGVEGYDGLDPAVTAPLRHPVIGVSKYQGKELDVLRIDAEGAEQGVDFGEFIKAESVPGTQKVLFLFSNNRKVLNDGPREYDWRIFDPETGKYKIVSYGSVMPDHIFPEENGMFRVVGRNFDEKGAPRGIVDIVINPNVHEAHDFRDADASKAFTNLNALACDPEGTKYGLENIVNGNTVENNFYRVSGDNKEQFDYGFLKKILSERLSNKTILRYPIVLTQIEIVNQFVVVAGLTFEPGMSMNVSRLILASWPKDVANPAQHTDQVKIAGGTVVTPMEMPMIPSDIRGISLPANRSWNAKLGGHDAIAVTVDGCGSVVVPMDEWGLSEGDISFPNLGIAA